MRILVLAPHPFYQDRGTPIDVLLLLRVLVERPATEVDVVVYHEGKDIELPGLQIFRTRALPGLRNIRPGFSLKKLVCDLLLLIRAWGLVRRRHYDLIHAGEEAVFFAMLFKKLYGIPYAYDLDSSIAQQLVEKKPGLSVFRSLFNWLEGCAVRGSLITFPVCHALADLCHAHGARRVVTLHDISQLEDPEAGDSDRLRAEIGLPGTLFLYSGNLESYQGIDLLLAAFERALVRNPALVLVIIGGVPEDIERYRRQAAERGIADQTVFLGPRPLGDLVHYLAGADVLVCPRIRGINTPMKIFPYLHSGKPVLVTDLPTHNQLLTSEEAYLAPADPEGFAEGMLALAHDPNLRARLGASGRLLVERNHTYSAHARRVNDAYDWIEEQLEEARLDSFQATVQNHTHQDARQIRG
ncbi:hypothetical protein AWN76_015615 [Rhodothermaceae bacterium RA]|nr:hypothetical protein AWN76_015615 [Rhodothermaceae bacterium RA]